MSATTTTSACSNIVLYSFLRSSRPTYNLGTHLYKEHARWGRVGKRWTGTWARSRCRLGSAFAAHVRISTRKHKNISGHVTTSDVGHAIFAMER